MRAALLYGQEDLRLDTVPDPEPDVGEVIIRVEAATTCGTDLKVWRRGGHARMLTPPTLFGHEVAGQIAAIGAGVDGWKIGDRVVANNSAPCMQCFFCQKQSYSLCTDLCFNNGTYAEFLRVPAPIVQHNLLPIPDALPNALAAMTEPLACVLHGIARSNLRSGDRVLVIGDGPIGLMFVGAIAAGYGWQSSPEATPPTLMLIGGSSARLAVGEQFGAHHCVNYHQISDSPAYVRSLTEGWGADIVIEATGIPSVWELAIACARPGATINLFGGCPRDTSITVSTEQLHYSELTLKGVFHNTPHYVREALALLARRVVPFEQLISDHRPLHDLERTFLEMRDRQVMKVAIQPNL